MAKRAMVPACTRCDAPIKTAGSYCEHCGGPLPWASHDERIAWEVSQWRASRARAPQPAAPVMLVRTDEGFTPREIPESSRTPGADQPRPSPSPAKAPVPNAVGALAPIPVAPSVPISRKAVVLALVIVVALPFGSRALDTGRGTVVGAAKHSGRGAGPRAAPPSGPSPIVPVASGFVSSSPDSVRYAVVVRNPNRALVAYGVVLDLAFVDPSGKLVGTSLQRIGAVPAGAEIAVAGDAAVAGAPARIDTRVSGGAFESGAQTPFVVRDISVSRTAPSLLRVQAAVSGARPVARAQVVVVHLDPAGKVLGGDFTYIDVPKAPRAANAVIATSGVPAGVEHVKVFVLDPR